MPGGIKYAKKSSNEKAQDKDYKETMMKLKNYWPETTIDLYMSKAISLHDLDNIIVNDSQMADINKVILNTEGWYNKNPEYQFMLATKLLKEKSNIPTPSLMTEAERDRYPFRSRTRYERMIEEDQYSRRQAQFGEDIEDDGLDRIMTETAAEVFGGSTQGIAMPDTEVRSNTGQATARWDSLFGTTTVYNGDSAAGNTYSAPIITEGPTETVSNPMMEPTFQTIVVSHPETGDAFSMGTNIGSNRATGIDSNNVSWILDTDTGTWLRQW